MTKLVLTQCKRGARIETDFGELVALVSEKYVGTMVELIDLLSSAKCKAYKKLDYED